VPRMPANTYLSVNASHRTAMSSELLEVLGNHAPRIVVEITEHEAVADYVELLRALTQLRTHGIKIAIDDAGAGFSLRHTLEIAPNIVKVDISITRDIDKERARRALASALISFAEEMGITIVAEGIETQAELETLEGLGVLYGQGYHLAEPAPL
jgi:EAL domain-containing protein (putative c-di-GMP-specific phosphodiesterase class I)